MRSLDPIRLCGLTLALAVLAGGAAPAAAQSADDVLDRMQSEWESRTAGIDDYTVVMNFMGMTTTSYFVKEMVDGRPTFRIQESSMNTPMGVQSGPDDAGPGFFDDIYAATEEIKERATYVGREPIGSKNTHVIEVTDLEGMDLGQEMGDDGEFRPTIGRLYIDDDTYMPIRMVFEGELTNEEGVHTVTSTIDSEDIREHQGMLFAHRIIMTIEGLGAAMDAEARAQYEEMERQLAEMPPEQRRMVETMMAGQLEQFRAMMEGDEAMVMEMDITEIRVNAGPPGN